MYESRKKLLKKQSEMRHLHLEVEAKLLDQLRALHPDYGEVSHIIRRLIRGYLEHQSL